MLLVRAVSYWEHQASVPRGAPLHPCICGRAAPSAAYDMTNDTTSSTGGARSLIPAPRWRGREAARESEHPVRVCRTRTSLESEEEPQDCCGTPLGLSSGSSMGVTLVVVSISSQSDESCMAAIPMSGCACVRLYSSSTPLTG